MRRSVLNARVEELGHWRPSPVTALCVGSFARGDGDDDSNINVLLVRRASCVVRTSRKPTHRGPGRCSGSGTEFWRMTGNRCQVLDIDTGRLHDHVDIDEPLVANWRHDRVHLAGAALRSAIEHAESTR